MKKETMTKQYLLKMTPGLMTKIEEAFSKHLKKTGQYMSKAEFIRSILDKQCS
jgi:hypothetical protein